MFSGKYILAPLGESAGCLVAWQFWEAPGAIHVSHRNPKPPAAVAIPRHHDKKKTGPPLAYVHVSALRPRLVRVTRAPV